MEIINRIMYKTATWILLLLFFVGCQQQIKAPTPEHCLKGTVTFVKQGESYEANFSSPVLGSYSFVMTQPSSVAGMTVQVENGKVSYAYREITYQVDQEKDHSLFQEIAQILEQSTRGENIVWQESAVEWIGKGENDKGSFTVIYHKKTNRPVSLETQSGLTAQFHIE